MEGRIEAAETLFGKAGQGAATEQSFLAEYRSQAPELIRRQSEQDCSSNLDEVKLDSARSIDLQDVLVSMPEATSGDEWRRAKLCLLAGSGSELVPEHRDRLLRSLLENAGSPDEWRVDEAAYLGTLLINEHDPLSSAGSDLAIAEQLLESALRRLNSGQSDAAFAKIVEACSAGGPKAWCWELADDLAQASQKWSVLARLASALSEFEPRRYLRRALNAAETADEARSSAALPPEDDEWSSSYLAFYRAVANENLAALGEPHEDPRKMYERVIASLNSPLLKEISSDFQIDVHVKLIDYLNSTGHSIEARNLTEAALKRWPENPRLLASKMWIGIGDGDLRGAAAAASVLADKTSDDKQSLFEPAVGALLIASALADKASDDKQLRSDPAVSALLMGESTGRHAPFREFLGTEDPYVTYVALLTMAFASDEADKEYARSRLKRLWDSADRGRWETRLRHGDPSVWREMLNGYALGYVNRDELAAPLKDEATFQVSQFRNLPLSFQGVRCEFHFYDAVLAKLKDDRARMIQELQAAIDTRYYRYSEYKMAKFRLMREAEVSD
jgi:hypothetical protein